jgi:hypothetical protein
VALPVVLLVSLPALPAEAAVRTSSGVRCTIVGTARANTLIGTKHRDVICGRGGADFIKGLEGDDLIDPGAGADEVYGGRGNDRVLASKGDDVVIGGRGRDYLSGGTGRDVLYGRTGSDRLSGDEGADYLDGQAGSDTIYGGAGEDTIEGGSSADHLFGQSDDDHLTGGTGADALDGGGGENQCSDDPADTSVRCYFAEDKAPPVIVETRLTPASVDVSTASSHVTVLVHVTDDTGVSTVRVQLRSTNDNYRVQLEGSPGERVSGTLHDGWWRSSFAIAIGTPAGDLEPLLSVTDTVGRVTYGWENVPHVDVADANPDNEIPQVTLVEPLGTEPVDIRTQSADVTVSVRITDDRSGVARVDLALGRPDHPYYTKVATKDDVPISSGTVVDGIWTAVLHLPMGWLGGDWNVMAYVTDRSGVSRTQWLGVDAYQRYVDNHATTASMQPFPDAAGRVTVIGQ